MSKGNTTWVPLYATLQKVDTASRPPFRIKYTCMHLTIQSNAISIELIFKATYHNKSHNALYSVRLKTLQNNV